MNFIENITFRRKRANSITEQIADDNNCTIHTPDGTISLPDISHETSDEAVADLKQQLESLKLELQIAHDEVQNLTLENNTLKNTIQNLTKKNEMFKTVTKALKTTVKTPKKTNKNDTSTPLQKEKPEKNKQNDKIYRPIEKKYFETTNNTVNKKRKLCIISSNNKNKILSIAQNNFSDRFKICHYCKPNAGIKDLLTGIDTKLENYTENDYCIILIGESDFMTTNNYLKLVLYMRETTQLLTHTNIVFCLPTYKYTLQKTLYNWRIETFNNLLYLDITTNRHAYVFDSNNYLSYDFDMFSKYNGHLNNNGMNIIVKELSFAIQDLDKESAEDINVSTELNFFLV